MRRKNLKNKAFAMSMALFATAASAQADVEVAGGKATVSGEVNVGVQQKVVDGSSSKFEEHRDVQNGVLLNDLRIKVDGKNAPYYIDLKVKNPVQENEFYNLQGGVHGKFKVGVFYDSIPHNFNTGTLILSGAGSDRLTIADTIQGDLEALEQTRGERGGNPNTDTTGEDAAQQAIVRDLLANTNKTTFKLKREKTGFSLDYNVTPDIKTWAKVTNEKRTGARVITAGTYERYNQGPNGIGHTADLFFTAGMELAEPIDYRTTVLNVGAGVYKKNWLADAEYTFTNFDNGNQSLVWDNPFRITDASATNNTDVNTANGFNRGRFETGQIALTPSSQSHDFSVSGSVDLPLHSRFAANLGYGWITQDEAFVPYTLNSALAGVGGGPADITSTSALPQRDLDGEVRTINQSYVLTSKPLDSLALAAKYRYYDYDNKSDAIHFDGFAAFGESYWRTVKNAPSVDPGAVVENEPLSFTRQNAEVSVDYHVAKPLTVFAEGFWEDWDRKELRIDGTTELGIGGGFIYKPVKFASVKGSYKFSHRAVDGYKRGDSTANPEAVGLANYDWADRERQKADLRVTVNPVETLTVGFIGQYLEDEFGDDNRFGLKKQESAAGAFDIAYSPSERLTVFANYTKEYRKGAMQSGAKDDKFNDPGTAIDDAFAGDNFNPLNYWNTDIREKTDTIGLGATVQIVPEKLILTAGYTFSHSKMEFANSNPNGAVKLDNAEVQAWPDVTSRLQEVKADLAYAVTKNLKVGINYLYEWYSLKDFANTGAYVADASAENTTRFVFTGANNYSYDAHVAGAYLTYKF